MPVYKNEDNGTWYVLTRYVDWKGERKQKCKRGFETKREAQEWERVFKQQSAADMDMNFSAFVELYIKDIKPRLKENTWLTKKHIIETKILPYFEKKNVSEITTKDVIAWQNELLAFRDEKKKPYSQTYLKTVHNQLIQLRTVFEAVTDSAFTVIYGKCDTVKSTCCFTEVVHIVLNIIRLYRYFFLYGFYGSGIGTGNGNRPLTGRKIAVTVIKQRRFNTNDALCHQFGKENFFFEFIPNRQLIITMPDTFNISLLKKCINILFFQSGRNEIRFLCNFTDCIKYFVYDIVLTQTTTNFLHAVFSLCVFIL